MLILDTDHLVEFDRGSDAGETLRQRLEMADEEIATTISSAEEQFRGWLAHLSQRRMISGASPTSKPPRADSHSPW